MHPVDALNRVAYLLERELAEPHRIRAFRRAARRLASLDPADLDARVRARSLTDLPDLGARTAAIALEAAAGGMPAYLAELEARNVGPVADGGATVRSWLVGDLHTHSDWSDGYGPIEDMARAAAALGHSYLALTDHSPRLTVARGLSPERLREQLDVVASLNAELAPFRILTGIEVDILEDGSLDQEDDLLDALDVVVASIHSKLRMEAVAMTRRMVTAVANPRVDILGHVTGRLVTGGRGTRPPSQLDAEIVFEACRHFDVAVEINSRPERRDPPTALLELAIETGCTFAVDTDAHAPGQLELIDHGCARAQALGITRDRILNALPVTELLARTA